MLSLPSYAKPGIPRSKQTIVWQELKLVFKDKFPDGHIERIEDALGRGVPDVYFCAPIDSYIYFGIPAPMQRARTATLPISGWIEIKCGYTKATPLQVAWHRRARVAGAIMAVLTVHRGNTYLDLKGRGNVQITSNDYSDVLTRIIDYGTTGR